ncbi:hypothetical protein Ddye_028110 [Dipteronia dyeriana]|uniref:Uncharacterized protein n=1 Tax=Dipteronia dyeriana TaxID=168575 RepID=A0AAD9TR97_9ROSI|nr:hypothetical protein Ddye_028110 [Dipteronia dyeriana]
MKPFQLYMSKMGTYEVEIHGVQVNVIVIDNEAVVDIEIAELRSSMKIPIVGLDVMFRNDLNNNFDSGCVVLCVDNCCSIILAHQMSSLPSSLRDFLADETISFVCKETTGPSYIRELYGCVWYGDTEIGQDKV